MRRENKMTTGVLTGINFEVDGGSIELFSAKGLKLDGGKWGINGFFCNEFVEVSPGTVIPIIKDCITDDIKAGNELKLAQLQLGAKQAVVLFLEGKLTQKHFEHATEENGFIYVPNVKICGHTLTVRIEKEAANDVTTADKYGNVI